MSSEEEEKKEFIEHLLIPRSDAIRLLLEVDDRDVPKCDHLKLNLSPDSLSGSWFQKLMERSRMKDGQLVMFP